MSGPVNFVGRPTKDNSDPAGQTMGAGRRSRGVTVYGFGGVLAGVALNLIPREGSPSRASDRTGHTQRFCDRVAALPLGLRGSQVYRLSGEAMPEDATRSATYPVLQVVLHPVSHAEDILPVLSGSMRKKPDGCGL